MNIYENVATEAIASFFHYEPLWKNEILFGFLLKPFGLSFSDVIDVETQENLKGTRPDFTIKTKKDDIRFEVKINDSSLTSSEQTADTRNAYLIRKDYEQIDFIPVDKDKVLFWEDLFDAIDKKGAMAEFSRLALVREYMNYDEQTLLLTPHEVAMLYSPDTVFAVYSMSEKVLGLCKNFLNTHSSEYELNREWTKKGLQQDKWGIGYYFKELKGKKRSFYLGLNPSLQDPYFFAVALEIDEEAEKNPNWYYADNWAYFPLDKEILAKCDSDEDLQEAFNKNVEEVIASIDK